MTFQYYPTGEHTAAKMWAKFKRPIRHVCDPSAGKGSLIAHAKNGFPALADKEIPWVQEVPDESVQLGRWQERLREHARRKFTNLPEVSVVEIDLQHHASLKELDCKILGYDFLQVQSLATVSHVIMNPPFQDGATHVLHAWDCVYDAEIVAIINAQTIRNPFSAERQRLMKLIEQHGTVEFLQDEFSANVERKTEVEVALVYLQKVPGQYLDMDSLLGDLKRGDNHFGDINSEVCTALSLPGNFIQDTCHRFEQAVAAARKACEASALANHLASGIGITLAQMQAKGVGNEFREAACSIRDDANSSFKECYSDLKSRAWSQILRSSLLTDKLSNQARRKVEASAESIYAMEFSAANVHGFLAGVLASLGDIYKDMVCDLFDTIIERATDNVTFYKSWKSNAKHRVGVRIRRTRFIIPRFEVSFRGSLSYESKQFLADVDKVFGYLHGITDGYDGIVQGFENNHVLEAARISTRFFDFRYYKGAQTIHFYPKDESVVEKINQFVGKIRQWLPGDIAEANADFQRQYDKGESFTKEYLENYRQRDASGYSHRFYDPARLLIKQVRGKDLEGDGDQLARFSEAIEKVHEAKGLHTGPSLTHAPSVALALTHEKHEAPPRKEQQLDLIID